MRGYKTHKSNSPMCRQTSKGITYLRIKIHKYFHGKAISAVMDGCLGTVRDLLEYLHWGKKMFVSITQEEITYIF